MIRFSLVIAAGLAAAAVVLPSALAGMGPLPLTTVHSAKLGTVVTTHEHLALYTWNRERDFKVRCTGSCAKQWPPLLVAKGARVPMHVAGVMGDLGSVVRPDGARQLTLDRRPLYTYSGDGPGEVKCNGVDGWFVVRVH